MDILSDILISFRMYFTDILSDILISFRRYFTDILSDILISFRRYFTDILSDILISFRGYFLEILSDILISFRRYFNFTFYFIVIFEIFHRHSNINQFFQIFHALVVPLSKLLAPHFRFPQKHRCEKFPSPCPGTGCMFW